MKIVGREERRESILDVKRCVSQTRSFTPFAAAIAAAIAAANAAALMSTYLTSLSSF
jgi:hypothetical protein